MKIAIIGTGYVGLSLAILISQKYEVIALDIDRNKVEQINNRKSPFKDKEIENYLENRNLKLTASLIKDNVYDRCDIIIVATPTNYDPIKGYFDTTSVQTSIQDINNKNKDALIVIKSTVPFGFTKKMRQVFNRSNIIFSPEFLRETKALHDNLYPTRIIIGDNSKQALKFAELLSECALKETSNIPILTMTSNEAEAVKLFANTFLAMRISFFNELDSFAEVNNLSTEKIISAIGKDERIGNYYNNPSFGYGGYCLPKDTKQLLKNYNNIPNKIIRAVVESNEVRKEFIVKSILNKKPKIVGVYRLVMKNESDNIRESAVLDIINMLTKKNVRVLVFEPLVNDNSIIDGIELISSLEILAEKSDIIIANRKSKQLDQYSKKVYSRDLFMKD